MRQGFNYVFLFLKGLNMFFVLHVLVKFEITPFLKLFTNLVLHL